MTASMLSWTRNQTSVSDKETYRLAVYSTGSRWEGDLPISAQRRLSDYINDDSSLFLVLNHVVPALWENNSLGKSQEIESIALVKDNIIAVVLNSNAGPSFRVSSAERVQKVPQRVFVYAPPLFLQGDLHIPRQGNWIDVVSAPHKDFFPLTNANVWLLKNGTPVGANLRLALIHRRRVLGIESKEPNSQMPKEVAYPLMTRMENTR